MCGLAGFSLKNSTLPPTILEKMAGNLEHRGPDDQGFFGISPEQGSIHWKFENTKQSPLRMGLAFRRLSILDLTPQGAQPMTTQDARYHLVFNGQIYNYIELRDRLSISSLQSTSDSEVLLYLLAQYKYDILNELDGMFAFAFFDEKENTLFLARDPVGIKPLYYVQDERGFFFASEIKALLPILKAKPTMDPTLLSRFFLNGWIADPDTIFKEIKKLEPGFFLLVQDGKITEKKQYWNFTQQDESAVSLESWTEQLDASVRLSLRRQLRSDVPIAFFLSGGIDSSLLAAQACSYLEQKPTTYTIGFDWQGIPQERNWDLESARKLHQEFSFDYHEILLEPSIVSLLPKIIRILEEPISDAAAICSYLICQTAAKKHKVLLSGHGADEIFGGYPILQAGFLSHQLQDLPRFFRKFLASTVRSIPYSLGRKTFQSIHRIKKITSASLDHWPESFYLLRSPLNKENLIELLKPSLLLEQEPPFYQQSVLLEQAKHLSYFDQMLYLDFKTYLPSLNLTYSDKTSMANSVELRVPFLGKPVLDLVQKIPHAFKFNSTHSKILLKNLAHRLLPNEVIHRPKLGFGLPLRQWFLSDLQPMAKELFSASRLQKQGFFNPAVPNQWLKEHASRQADHTTKLFALLTFQLWIENQSLE